MRIKFQWSFSLEWLQEEENVVRFSDGIEITRLIIQCAVRLLVVRTQAMQIDTVSHVIYYSLFVCCFFFWTKLRIMVNNNKYTSIKKTTKLKCIFHSPQIRTTRRLCVVAHDSIPFQQDAKYCSRKHEHKHIHIQPINICLKRFDSTFNSVCLLILTTQRWLWLNFLCASVCHFFSIISIIFAVLLIHLFT